MKKIVSVLLLFCMLFSIVACFSGCGQANETSESTKDPNESSEQLPEQTDEEKYSDALAYLEEKKYEEAYAIFKELGDYEDSAKYLSGFYYALMSRTSTTNLDGLDSVNTLTVEFDSNNLPVKHVYYISKKESYDTFAYDDRGNLIEMSLGFDGDDRSIYEFTYDENDRLIKEVNTLTYGDTVSVVEYVYNEKGLLIQTVKPRDNGKKAVTDYIYDENDLLVKTVFTDSLGFETVYEYSYTEEGWLCGYVFTGVFGNETYNAYYDENGRIIKETFAEGEEISSEYNYTFDENGRLIKKTHDQGDLATVNEYSYDELGNLIKEVETFHTYAPCVFEYEYKLVYVPFDLPEKVVDLLTSGIE